MALVERFTSEEDFGDDRPGQADFEELEHIVEKTARKRGLLQIDEGEDEQTLQQFRIFTIGKNESEASSIVLIGNQADVSGELSDVGTPKRPHKLIASQDFIDEIKLEIAKKREATKFQSASSSIPQR